MNATYRSAQVSRYCNVQWRDLSPSVGQNALLSRLTRYVCHPVGSVVTGLDLDDVQSEQHVGAVRGLCRGFRRHRRSVAGGPEPEARLLSWAAL